MPVLEPATVSLRNILLATDFGPVAQAALQHTIPLARRNSARVYLLNVIRPSDQRAVDDAWREGQRYMTDQFIAGSFDAVPNKLLIEQGDVWSVIERKIQELEIDLVVTGANARTGLGKLLLGSVAETIFRQASCPVLLVGERAASRPAQSLQSILFCTGFSSHSLKAGAYALALAERQGAQLTLLHVVKDAPPERERDQAREGARQRLRSLVPADVKLASPPEFAVDFGPPAERILRQASQCRADLIVLGVRQPAGFARRVRWATAYEVATNAPCPVLTVRQTEFQ